MKMRILAIIGAASLIFPTARGAGRTSTPACVPPPSGLISWWRADGDATDASGTNNGQLLGGASFGAGKVSQGFLFNGGTSGVKLPASSTLDVGTGGGFTVEAWINPQDLSIRG